MKKVVLLIMAVTISACTLENSGVNADVYNDQGQLLPASNQDGDGQLFKIADGEWSTYYGADGISAYYHKNVWIDIQVPTWSSSKKVGIVWTDNNWATVHTTYAKFEASLGDGKERWGIDLTPIGDIKIHRSMGPVYWTDMDGNYIHLGYPHRSVVMQYAIFMNYDGRTLWNNNYSRNYQLVVVQ